MMTKKIKVVADDSVTLTGAQWKCIEDVMYDIGNAATTLGAAAVLFPSKVGTMRGETDPRVIAESLSTYIEKRIDAFINATEGV